MDNLTLLEERFKKIYQDLSHWPKESVVDIDIKVLHDLGLLHYHSKNFNDPNLTRYFQVIETDKKITLVNEEFIVWIVPDKQSTISSTQTIIALNLSDKIQVELIFKTKGVYNTSHLVLKILEKFLFDIQENEEMLKKLYQS